MSLASKYRPVDFSDVIGQPLVVKIISSMCMQGNPIHNFLLVGPAGCGKTTIARIIGTTLNGGECNPIEIDAASNSGVDAMRELAKQASEYPIGSMYKVFIIDECHALSNAAWQSLLKVLEETPKSSMFILCTTNPEKIPQTILSRVQTFQLSKIPTELIVERIEHIIAIENQSGSEITWAGDSLQMIAKVANGGMRDALTCLDKVLAYSSNITIETVTHALGMPNYIDYFDLLGSISRKNNQEIVVLIDRIYNSGVNFLKWIEGFQSFVINVAKYVLTKDESCTTIPSHVIFKMEKYGTAHVLACIRLSKTLTSVISELRTSSYQQEIVLSYLLSSKRNEEC